VKVGRWHLFGLSGMKLTIRDHTQRSTTTFYKTPRDNLDSELKTFSPGTFDFA